MFSRQETTATEKIGLFLFSVSKRKGTWEIRYSGY